MRKGKKLATEVHCEETPTIEKNISALGTLAVSSEARYEKKKKTHGYPPPLPLFVRCWMVKKITCSRQESNPGFQVGSYIDWGIPVPLSIDTNS
jgi:hypothetical protein